MSITSQIFILILKSLTSDPVENLTGFFFQVTLNCIIEGTLSNVAIEMGKESKNYYKERGQMPPGAREVIKLCPLSC